MKSSVGVFILGAAFALTLGAPASNPQETDWLGIVAKLKEMKAIYIEGHHQLISIAVQESREIGADMEHNLKSSYVYATRDLDHLMTQAKDEVLVPFEAWLWLLVAQQEINQGWEDISEEREKLSASAHEELDATFGDMLDKADVVVHIILDLICFENPGEDFICDLPRPYVKFNKEQISHLRKTLA